MRDVYACSFNLEAAAFGVEEAFDVAVAETLGWAFGHYQDRAALGDLDRASGSWERQADYIEWRTLAVEGLPDRLWSMVYVQRDRLDDSLAWRTSVQVGRASGILRFTLRLAIDPTELRILPAKFEVGRPGIVPILAEKLTGTIDGLRVSRLPTLITSGEVGGLVDLLLLPERRMPVVVLSVDPRYGRPLVDPRRTADRLVGVAHVAALQSGEPAWEITNRLGNLRLSVFNGAVRVYWPGFTLDANPFDHRLWVPDRIDELESSGRSFIEQLTRLVSSVAVLRVPGDPLARRLLTLADHQRREEMEELRLRIAAAPDEFTSDLWADYERVLDTNKDLARRIEELEGAKAAIQQNFAAMARELSISGELGDSDTADAYEVLTLLDAVDAAAKEFADELVFLPPARESADGWTYPNVPKLHLALRTIGAIVRRWRLNDLPAGFAGAFKEAGLDYAPGVSTLTVGQTGSEYVRTHNGTRIILGPHVKLGKGTSAGNLARIYWWVDEDTRQFVIGHVGRHLEDGTT